MKKSTWDFLEGKNAPTPQQVQQALKQFEPVLREQRIRTEFEGRLSGRGALFRWGLAGVATAGVAVFVLARAPLSPLGRPESAQTTVTPPGNPVLVPVASLALAPPAVQSKPAPPASTPRARPKKADTIEEIAVEFLREMDMILVLPVLNDLEVLRRWSGNVSVASFPLPWLTVSPFASCWADEIPIGDDFLDQIIKVLPNLPRKDQLAIFSSLERIKPLWEEKKQVLVENYRSFRRSEPDKQQLYRDRFTVWQGLSARTQTEVLSKYEKWKKLSERQRERIRKKVLSESSNG